jgi:hypothetical protein
LEEIRLAAAEHAQHVFGENGADGLPIRMLFSGAGTAVVDLVEFLTCGLHHVERVSNKFFQG